MDSVPITRRSNVQFPFYPALLIQNPTKKSYSDGEGVLLEGEAVFSLLGLVVVVEIRVDLLFLHLLVNLVIKGLFFFVFLPVTLEVVFVELISRLAPCF